MQGRDLPPKATRLRDGFFEFSCRAARARHPRRGMSSEAPAPDMDVPDMDANAHTNDGGMEDGDLAGMTWKVAIGVTLVIITALYIYRRQNKEQDAAAEVDAAIFQSTLIADDIGNIIATTHKELIEKGEAGELDLDELGPSAWPDMPNAVLAYIMEDLLNAGTQAVGADDHEGALLAFTEALNLEANARPDGMELSDVVEPLQSVAFRILLHRSGAYQALGEEQAAAKDAEAAQAIYKTHMPEESTEQEGPGAEEND